MAVGQVGPLVPRVSVRLFVVHDDEANPPTSLLAQMRAFPEGLTDHPAYVSLEETPMLTKEWYASKINWTAIIGGAVSMLTLAGFVVPDQFIPATVAFLVAGQSLLTIIMRTWFTTHAISNSVK